MSLILDRSTEEIYNKDCLGGNIHVQASNQAFIEYIIVSVALASSWRHINVIEKKVS